MKIVVVGATGTIGSLVADAMKEWGDVVELSRNSQPISIDLTDLTSIQTAFEAIGTFDHLVLASGAVTFKDFVDLDSDDWAVGLNDKLMGQIHATRLALPQINDAGSITLTSGVLNAHPIRAGISASTVNAALDAFVENVHTELPRGIRINCISPTVLTEALDHYGPFFPGFKPIDGADVARAYVKAAMGIASGRIYTLYQDN